MCGKLVMLLIVAELKIICKSNLQQYYIKYLDSYILDFYEPELGCKFSLKLVGKWMGGLGLLIFVVALLSVAVALLAFYRAHQLLRSRI